jgi:hypothetical protein
MTDATMLESMDKLDSDHDGSYRTQIISQLEKYRDEFAVAKQGLLPPDDFEVVDHLEKAIRSAISIVKDYQTT